ncbi:helix-turn-helix domain-containing protein [Mycolicibacterium goodii]|uniref:helix-turn-helix domain-containing protein n=1 Tax=Mycolicibacterium goodii TaxID=134601 RepID=UPI001BDC4417|nr:helix-turn-helix domain-containing protein [Mycolicibacterium goodii]MBU8807533.1 helix-turn-helix domain-containing protein [Mycolicibacterium goodii]MBU8829064.1 helix-turn-helix domain-containing protein [Mycolicibacterium goodii]
MSLAVYSAEQVADILGLHVRTVRGYVRDGRLPAVRMGKQYRITERDLQAFAGVVTDEPASRPRAHVSGVVHVDNVDRLAMDRITAHLGAATISDSNRPGQLNVHSSYDESARRLTVFVVGDPEATASAIGLIGALTRQDDK